MERRPSRTWRRSPTKLTEVVATRVDPKEAERLRHKADENGLSLADLVRQILAQA
jgi:predicted HicB family RNase H-like nuclease